MRLFMTEKTYDYESVEKALKHMEKMRAKGYETQKRDDYIYVDNTPVYENSGDELPYSITYQKY